jgi:hypothetical protein
MNSKLKRLSPSSVVSLHTCPRKYQLQKLWPDLERDSSVHTDYGNMFHAGIQTYFATNNKELALLTAATEWKYNMDDFDKEKSFYHCWAAITQFIDNLPYSELADFDLAYVDGKPATEVGFRIDLGNGFYYRGFIDLILKHKQTGNLLVVDLKTSGAKYSLPAKYQNSSQNLAYSAVLDTKFPGLQNFNVMYFEYLTSVNKFIPHTFFIDCMTRATFIRDLLLTMDIMNIYDQHEDWPMHGESCAGYGTKACRFIDTCSMPISLMLGPAVHSEPEDEEPYDIETTLQAMIDSQLELLEA